MTFTGSSANYFEIETVATSIQGGTTAAERTAGPDRTYVFLFNLDTDTGYLVADLDNDDQFETGIVLAGAGSAADLGFLDII